MEHSIPKTPHALATMNDEAIRATVAAKFALNPEEVALLAGDEDGAYFSEETPGLLCCLVIGMKDGFLYLVTGEVDSEGAHLNNLKCDIVA